ncbi:MULTISPECIES: hypothetical protein [unclassified Sphingobacterium]|uniref:hypothetical protein n=1 Tax=unclassified Sphingobacterium TaxID=2609468 RepID=UPI00104E6AC1|nr:MULTISPECIES: hypothetical protein [unclassified Sphingobacterium]MCS3557662.1 hypothetical protein [Sphingobacterium sp. JUb21]TCQ95047.1 hypothetical protein EDF66_1326 [Sphingobacterium sp. JUb20]
MIRVLINLGEAIAVYGILHQNKEEDEQTQKALLDALKEIEINSNHMYTRYGNHKMAQKSFRIFYSQLRLLFNIIYRKKNQQVDSVILKFHELFQTYEDIYSHDMDLEEPLTHYQHHLLKVEIMGEFPTLKDALIKKGIGQYLLLEIQSAIESYLIDNKIKVCYYHYLFFNKLLQSLTYIAQDSRNKDWERRFIETMININFNHMGFFNRCCELINYQLQNLCEDHQIMCIDINGLRISQASRDPKLYFDITRKHLADLLIEYAEQRKTIKKPRCLSTSDTESKDYTGVLSNLTAGGASTFYHYFQKENFLKAENKKSGAKNFASNVKLSNGANLTEAQLHKFDKGKHRNDIRSLAIKLRAILEQIEIDLDNSYGSSKNKR